MISLPLAASLQSAGLRWKPVPGDKFIVPNREMDDDVFVVSDMTVEVHEFESGTIIGFNGTTEWALDSVEQQEAVWLPTESQLREKLGGTFRRLERGGGRYRVRTEVGGAEHCSEHGDPAEAYGLALLDLIQG